MAGHVVYFAHYVPQSQINPADGSATHDAIAVPEVLSVHHLPQVLHTSWIFSHQQGLEIVYCAHDGARVPFQSGFSPAMQARLVGDDFDEDPVAHAGITD